MNLEKHVKTPTQELLGADFSLAPGQARSPHLVGHYIKDRKRHYESPKHIVKPLPILMRLEGLAGDPATRERIQHRVQKMNQVFQRTQVPFRMRVF